MKKMDCECSVKGIDPIRDTKTRKRGTSEFLKMSTLMDSKVEPLFHLPKELMDCRKFKKKMVEQSNARETSYTMRRFKKEKFRR